MADATAGDRPRVRVPAGSSRVDNTPEATGAAFIGHVLRKRDRPVFDWLCQALEQEPHEVAGRMLVEAVMREKPAYQEAHGRGGNTSRDADALAARLVPPR